MYIYTKLFTLFVATITVRCRIYNGICQIQNQTVNLASKNGFHYRSVFQIPLEKFEQEVYFFPTRLDQAMHLLVNHPFSIIIPRMSPKNKRFNHRFGIHVGNATNANRMEVRKIVNSKLKFICEVNRDIKTMIFVNRDAVLIFGCVDMLETNEHEEALWLFVNYFNGGHNNSQLVNSPELFNVYKQWAIEQLKFINSSIPQSDFNLYFSNDKIKYTNESYHFENGIVCPVRKHNFVVTYSHFWKRIALFGFGIAVGILLVITVLIYRIPDKK